MNRLQKKCLLGSAAMHGLLAVILLFGSAFFTPSHKNEIPPVIEIVPDNPKKTTDGHSTGGDPNVAPAPAPKPLPVVAPAPPAPTPPPVAAVKPPEPVKPKEVAKEKEPEQKPAGDEPDPDKKKPTKKKSNDTAKTGPRISTNIVHRSLVDVAAVRAQRESQERADREYADNLRKWQAVGSAISSAAHGLGKGITGTVVSDVGSGPGGGGPATANWRAAVGELYMRAWAPPQDAGDSAKVETRVTIARDGSVLSGRITQPSGDSSLDRSVQKVLRDVRSAPPLPDDTKEDQRTVTIIFDLTVKRALG